MKYAGWITNVVLAVLIVVQVRAYGELKSADDRESFLVLPHSVILDRAYAEPSSQLPILPELAGLTADDVVRGILYLIDSKQEPISAEQAAELLPQVEKMNVLKNKLLTLRNDRHGLNEASMEQVLEVGGLLNPLQVSTVIKLRRSKGLGAVADEQWNELLAALGDK